MNNYEKEAIETALRWNEEGFNKRNKEITIEYLHFPHVRLWENKFSIFEDAEAFLKGYDIQTENLKKEGWDHTVTLDIKAVQSEEQKVHLLLHQSRRNKEGKEYHNFQTLWILTKINNTQENNPPPQSCSSYVGSSLGSTMILFSAHHSGCVAA